MSPESVLEITGLCKRFGPDPVVDGVNLRVRSGHLVGFVGPNGAGKSTCLRCVLGITFPDAGHVRLDGIDAIADPVRARRRVGYLPGETSLYAGLRGEELLAFGLSFYPDIDTATLDWCRQRFRVPLHRKIRTYSAGQKQLLALTMALAPHVPLYILDEPDKALDATMRHELRVLLREFKARGKSLLVSSHHISELEGMADDFAFLLDGRIIEEDKVEAERRRLSRQVRATFPTPPGELALPAGTQREWDEEVLVLTPAADVAIEAIVEALLPHAPSSLDYGHASLQEIYESLYLGRGR